MKKVFANGKEEYALIDTMRSRSAEIDKNVTNIVKSIIDDVKLRGDKAVLEYTKKFDGVEAERFEIEKSEIDRAYNAVSSDIIMALERAAENIKDFHERQKRESFIVTKEDGVVMGQRVRGLACAGLYVPGGKAAYPSSVLMNAIPAKVANVGELVMVTPPSKAGVDQSILAAAKIAGIDRVFAVGGAQAVAALAFGTQSIPKVDKIVGPGNVYVAAAKRLVFGTVDIDMIAGPSEILIIADETANPAYLAADLMSQAEHDPMASAVLITTSSEIADNTLKELEKQLKTLSRNAIISESINNFGAAIICRDMVECVKLANEIAPEHLELMVANPMQLLGSIDNAGSVFLGQYSPEPLGDYYAGPNHVLPTSGTARFFSPLSVDAFIKKSSFIYYTKKALEKSRDDIVTLAMAEGLTAHANSIKVRFDV
jgi:histidinol dehydrogenase